MSKGQGTLQRRADGVAVQQDEEGECGHEEGDKDAQDEEDEADGAFGLVALLLAKVEEEDAGDERRRQDEQGEVEYHSCFCLSELGEQIVEGAGDAVEEFVHQFEFLHLGDVDDDFLAGAGHPAGLGVGAAAAGEDEDAGVGPAQGVQVGGELAFGLGVVEAFAVFFEGPGWGVLVDVGPVEAGAAVGRVAEVVDFVARLAQAPYDFGEVLVSPAGGYVDLCHVWVGLFGVLKDSHFPGIAV